MYQRRRKEFHPIRRNSSKKKIRFESFLRDRFFSAGDCLLSDGYPLETLYLAFNILLPTPFFKPGCPKSMCHPFKQRLLVWLSYAVPQAQGSTHRWTGLVVHETGSFSVVGRKRRIFCSVIQLTVVLQHFGCSEVEGDTFPDGCTFHSAVHRCVGCTVCDDMIWQGKTCEYLQDAY